MITTRNKFSATFQTNYLPEDIDPLRLTLEIVPVYSSSPQYYLLLHAPYITSQLKETEIALIEQYIITPVKLIKQQG